MNVSLLDRVDNKLTKGEFAQVCMHVGTGIVIEKRFEPSSMTLCSQQ